MGKVIQFKRKLITKLNCKLCNSECEREDNQYLHWHCKTCGNNYMISQETGNIIDFTALFSKSKLRINIKEGDNHNK